MELCKSLLAIADLIEPGQTRFRGQSRSSFAFPSADGKQSSRDFFLIFFFDLWPPGVTLYEMHAPLCLLLKQAFESNEIKADEFKEKTSQVCTLLKEAMAIL